MRGGGGGVGFVWLGRGVGVSYVRAQSKSVEPPSRAQARNCTQGDLGAEVGSVSISVVPGGTTAHSAGAVWAAWRAGVFKIH